MSYIKKSLKIILGLAIPIFIAGSQQPFIAATAQLTSPFAYVFSFNGTLTETGDLESSSSPYWWLNSGAYMTIKNGRGWTLQGSLPANNPWRMLYLQNNPVDTDQGYHPQNIFRLVSRKNDWGNIVQEAYFKISKDNLSSSPNRNESNGLLLFNRYRDSNNLYYTGIRRDGAAVIKKKQNGIYYTLATGSGIFPGAYNRETSPNLIPIERWIGLRSETINNPDGSVSIKLFMDFNWNNDWQLVVETVDDGTFGTPLSQAGAVGIRTDFMDIEFDNYQVKTIQP